MPVEVITGGIQNLNPAWPLGTDQQSEGDNHIRLIKDAIQKTFPNSPAPWTAAQEIAGIGYNANSGRVQNVGAPTEADDAARKADLDGLAANFGARSRGKVNAGGTLLQGVNIQSVVRQSAGVYLVTFAVAAASIDQQVIQASVASSANGFIRISGETTTACTVNTAAENGAAADRGFYIGRETIA